MTRLLGARHVMATCVAAALVGGCATSATTTVEIPWTSKSPPAGGVAAFTVTAGSGGQEAFTVEVGGVGSESWRAAAWGGATTAMIAAGLDPRGRTLSFDLVDQAQGTSGGSGLAAASWATLDGVGLRPDVAVVGRILPNGSLAPVTDVAGLIRQCADHGIREVLVTRGSRPPSQLPGGVAVSEVATLQEAYEQIRDEAVPLPVTATPQFDPGLTELVTIATGQIVEQVRVQAADLPPRRRPAAAALTQAAADADDLLAQGKPWPAYARITGAQQAYVMAAAGWSVPRLSAESQRAVTRALQLATARAGQRLELAASTPLTHVEQFTALGDALTWATGTLAILRQAGDRLAAARTGAHLRSVAREIAKASYRIDTYLPLQVEAVAQIGEARAGDPTALLQFLDAYALLLAQAADAAVADPEATDGTLPELLSRATAQQGVWREAPDPDGSQEVTMTRLAAAMSYYISAAYAVAATGPLDQQFIESQLAIATAENAETAAQLAGMGFDPSYVLWGDEWGRTWAASGGNAKGDVRRRGTGVTYQWYATVQGAMLRALAP